MRGSGEQGAGGPEVSVVVPLYNEQENAAELHRRASGVLRALGESHEILFVNDGSSDETASILDELQNADPNLVVVHLSRNFGHQAAVTAGLDHARGRAVIVMDGDLQDPPEVIPLFLDRWRDGYDVVYAIRQHRKEGPLKKLGYASFYRLLRSVSDIEIPLDSGDFCLMDRKVVDALKGLPERVRFVRGLRTFVGFRQVGLAYDRAARLAGKSKYSLAKLVRLAVDGLVSFSGHPLHVVTYLGVVTICLALILCAWVFIDAFSNRTAPRGWASLVVVSLFMGSVQLIGLGIIGEYLRLIFVEVKGRPTYIVGRYEAGRTGPDRVDRAGVPAAEPSADGAGVAEP